MLIAQLALQTFQLECFARCDSKVSVLHFFFFFLINSFFSVMLKETASPPFNVASQDNVWKVLTVRSHGYEILHLVKNRVAQLFVLERMG